MTDGSATEAAAIRRASTGHQYQTSLAAAGKRVAARINIDQRLSAIGTSRAAAATYHSLAGGVDGEAWEEEHATAWAGTAPPTPIASWLADAQALRPRAASMALEVGRTRNAATAQVSVHGKPFEYPELRAAHREIGTGPASVHGSSQSYRAGEYDLHPSAQPYDAAAVGARARTPEPRPRTPDIARTIKRNMGPSYESMGPVGYDDDGYEEAEMDFDDHNRFKRTSEPDAGRQSVGGLPPLPSKAELFQYVRELVDAKKELRAHFNVGALHGLKRQYRGR